MALGLLRIARLGCYLIWPWDCLELHVWVAIPQLTHQRLALGSREPKRHARQVNQVELVTLHRPRPCLREHPLDQLSVEGRVQSLCGRTHLLCRSQLLALLVFKPQVVRVPEIAGFGSQGSVALREPVLSLRVHRPHLAFQRLLLAIVVHPRAPSVAGGGEARSNHHILRPVNIDKVDKPCGWKK